MQTRDEVEGLHNFTEKKTQKLFVMALIKTEILSSPKDLYAKSCTRNQFLFCKKMPSKFTDFSRLRCQLERKKLTQLVCKVSADEGMGK